MKNYGDTRRYKYVGFIRTNSFLKTVDMFNPDRVMHMCIERGVQKEVLREVYPNDSLKAKWLVRDRRSIDNYVVEWDVKKNAGQFPAALIKGLIARTKDPPLGDFVVDNARFVFDSQELADYLNAELKAAKKRPCFSKSTRFYATFESNHSDDLRTLPFIQALNAYELEHYLFKLSSLDLVKFNTDRAEKYGEEERISVNDEVRLVKLVLKGLVWDGWPVPLRTLPGGIVAKPVSVRQYTNMEKKGWQLTGEVEVD